MIAPEKPPLRIANSTSSRLSLRTLKFGPSVGSPGRLSPAGFEPYSFDPNRVVVGGAGTVRIVLRNEGDLAHDIHLRRDGKDIGGTPSFAPRGTRSVRLRLQPGTYEMLCTVGDHAQLGMKGELEVR